jgi:ribonuclease HII
MVSFIAGNDEAGRGPLIGPLVICVAAIAEGKEPALKELGVKDSKLLTQSQRESILTSMIKLVHYEVKILEPETIDVAVLSENYNLNWLEADAAAELLNKLDAKLDNTVAKAIIDCPSNNITAYANYIRQKIDNRDIQLLVEHKADLHHLIVGAASIIAKVTREHEIDKLKKKYKIDFGSGYPSDPKTRDFLKKYHDDPKLSKLFRKSWAPYAALKQKKKQSNLDAF